MDLACRPKLNLTNDFERENDRACALLSLKHPTKMRWLNWTMNTAMVHFLKSKFYVLLQITYFFDNNSHRISKESFAEKNMTQLQPHPSNLLDPIDPLRHLQNYEEYRETVKVHRFSM